jgi:hypothetical protein
MLKPKILKSESLSFGYGSGYSDTTWPVIRGWHDQGTDRGVRIQSSPRARSEKPIKPLQ